MLGRSIYTALPVEVKRKMFLQPAENSLKGWYTDITLFWLPGHLAPAGREWIRDSGRLPSNQRVILSALENPLTTYNITEAKVYFFEKKFLS